jgi:hypothetical protein
MGESTSVYRDLFVIRKGKGSLGRLIGRWVDNIKMDLQKWDVGV